MSLQDSDGQHQLACSGHSWTTLGRHIDTLERLGMRESDAVFPLGLE